MKKQTAFLVVLALSAGLYLLILLPDYIGVGADTVIYYAAAQNLLDGQGLTLPFTSTFAGGQGELMTHFPPLYPVALAFLGYFTGGAPQAAWLLSVGLFAANVLLVGLIMQFYVPKPAWIPVLAALFMLLSPAVIRLHTVALSEPLFILFWLVGFFLLDRYLNNESQWYFGASALLSGLTFLTRYPGIAAIGAACLWLAYRRGWKTAVTYGVLSASPMIVWLGCAQLQGIGTNREIAVHWISSHHLWQGVYTISAWLAPRSLPVAAQLLIWLILLGGIGRLVYRREFSRIKTGQTSPDFFRLLWLFTGVYLAVIIFSISFLDVQVRLSPRILAPVYIALLLILLYAVSLWQPQVGRTARQVGKIMGVTLLLAYAAGAVYTFMDIRQNGEHYTGVQWQNSATIRWLQEQEADGRTPIISNGPDIIYLKTGLPAAAIPARYVNTSLRPSENYGREIAQMEKEMAAGAQLVYFNDMAWRWFLPTEEELTTALPLRPVRRFADGAVYALDK